MAVPSDEYFERVARLRPMMEEFNRIFLKVFEVYLNDPKESALCEVLKLRNNDVSVSCGNAYGFISDLYKICDIAIREYKLGYTPITNGAYTYSDAIDQYHLACFMKRRIEFLDENDFNNSEETMLLEEAHNYILTKVSPIALWFIIQYEIGGPVESAIKHWGYIYRSAGKEKEAQILEAL